VVAGLLTSIPIPGIPRKRDLVLGEELAAYQLKRQKLKIKIGSHLTIEL
jgi:hypothetical protein